MAQIFAKNGVLLAQGNSLRGCCCDECALVVVAVKISSSYSAPGSGGSGYHLLDSEVVGVCSAHARIGASTMTELWGQSDSENCSPSPSCGSALAYAVCEYMTATAKIPYKKGNVEIQTAKGYFSSTKINVGTVNNWAKWTLSIRYFSQNGGAPNANTRKPNVRVNVAVTNYSTNGADRTWAEFKQTIAVPGAYMGRFDWGIFFT